MVPHGLQCGSALGLGCGSWPVDGAHVPHVPRLGILANVNTDKPRMRRIWGFGGAALLFSVLVIAVRIRWVPLESVDRGVADELNELIAPSHVLVSLMGGVSRVGSFAVLFWLITIGATLLLVRRQFRLAAFLGAAAVGGLVLDPTLKAAVGRLRPVVEQPVAHGGGNSFPSGHALNSLICYAALLLVFLPALRRSWRRPVLIATGAVVVLIGFSRLALGVHFLSDVLGGWALGAAWIGLCAAAFELMRQQHGDRVTAPLEEGLEPEAADDLHPTEPHDGELQPAPLGHGQDGTPRGPAWIVTAIAVAWVLTFGALVGLGTPLARYHKGNGNVLGTAPSRTGSPPTAPAGSGT
ncbi:phosphatase PAP2 family protein [Dactylosporangium darangshiense]|uniref:phosphatase PAP2 family protein n=1 Tax=Dactylosporangium darangshiense TaxID=579108 RepID=UPI003627A6F0